LTGRWWPQRRRLRRRRLHRCLGLFYFICYVFSVLPLWVFDFLLFLFFWAGWRLRYSFVVVVFACRRLWRPLAYMRNDRTWETKDLQMSLAFWLPNAARVGGPRWTVDGGQWATGDASQPVSQPASQWPGIYLSQEAGQANYIQNTRPGDLLCP